MALVIGLWVAPLLREQAIVDMEHDGQHGSAGADLGGWTAAGHGTRRFLARLCRF